MEVLEDQDGRALAGRLADEADTTGEAVLDRAAPIGDGFEEGVVGIVTVEGVEQQFERSAQRAGVGLPGEDDGIGADASRRARARGGSCRRRPRRR